MKAADFISAVAGVPVEDLGKLHVTDREVRLAVIFHEFSHCDTSNDAVPGKQESDADIRGALKEASKVFNNPEIGRTMLYARALTPYQTIGKNDGLHSNPIQMQDPHDTALDIDHAMHPETPVPDDDASAQLNALSTLYVQTHMDEPSSASNRNQLKQFLNGLVKDDSELPQADYMIKAHVYRELLAHHRDFMSASAQRKATLYLEAIDYFGLNKEANKAQAPAP
jgi:hypothetical protein